MGTAVVMEITPLLFIRTISFFCCCSYCCFRLITQNLPWDFPTRWFQWKKAVSSHNDEGSHKVWVAKGKVEITNPAPRECRGPVDVSRVFWISRKQSLALLPGVHHLQVNCFKYEKVPPYIELDWPMVTFTHLLLFCSLGKHENIPFSLYFHFISTRILQDPAFPASALGLITCFSWVCLLLPSEFLEGKNRMFSSLCGEYQLDDTHSNTSHWLLFIPRLCWSGLNTSNSFNYPSSQQGDTGFFFLPPSNRSTNGVKEGKLDHIIFLWQKLYFQISCCVVRVMK